MDKTTETQVLYNGRWVPKMHFRVYVYNESGKKIVNSYDEYTQAISSGIWKSDESTEEGEKVVSIKRGRGKKCLNQASQ